MPHYGRRLLKAAAFVALALIALAWLVGCGAGGLPFEVSWYSPQGPSWSPEGPSGDLNSEWLEIKATAATNLRGYKIENFRGEVFVFPDLPLARGQTVRLRSGAGTPSSSDLYWGASAPMWNVPQPATGGIGGGYKVFDPEGHLLDELSWWATP
jgi:hypothetical protein